MALRFCGPKVSTCCFVLSLWGIIMLLLLGVFFSIKSVALSEDVPTNDEKGYSNTAKNCFIAAGIYGVTFLVSAYQRWVNSRTGSTEKLKSTKGQSI